MVTSPMIIAPGAIKTSSAITGCFPLKGRIAITPPSIDHAFDALDDASQSLIIVSISRIKAANGDAMIGFTCCMNIVFVIQSHSHVFNTLTAEKDQIAPLYLLARHGMGKRIVLLIGIAWKRVATHPITELD